MKKITVTLGNKRFLIVWMAIHAFALFVNTARVRGTIKTDNPYKDESHIWTTANDWTYGGDFWPFTTFFKHNDGKAAYSPVDGHVLYQYDSYTVFNGLFNGYGYSEFLAYVVLGFCIVFVPKAWEK